MMKSDLTRPIARLLLPAARAVKLLAAVGPTNVVGERARLMVAFAAGGEATPRWTYARAERLDAEAMVITAERALGRIEASPHRDLYAARIEELALEIALATAVATPRFGTLAYRRFAPRDAALARHADMLALTWLGEPAPEPADEMLASDATHPESLLSRMRAEVGARRLPFAVVVERGLAPLAAIGERSIMIAAGRQVARVDVERTVLHEISGHALPMVRARANALPLYALGTARGSDDQEGYALVLEERGGFLAAGRRRELATRHVAVETMRSGATFVETARVLIRTHGVPSALAVLACERAYRGGDGVGGGLGRERVYLESWRRVRARLEARPEDEDFVSAGRVAVDAIDALRLRDD
jgi:hypothetical protein